MASEEDLISKIDELEKRKGSLIEKIKELNKRLRYKRYEQKALEPFLTQNKDVRTGWLRKKKQDVEFKIATEAYTPQIEREWLKEANKIDKELKKVQEIEKARRKMRFIGQDIEYAEKEIVKVETELKTLRDELNRLYNSVRTIRSITKSGIKFGGFKNEMVTLGDIGIIESENKK